MKTVTKYTEGDQQLFLVQWYSVNGVQYKAIIGKECCREREVEKITI
jgi:hypothetical protein